MATVERLQADLVAPLRAALTGVAAGDTKVKDALLRFDDDSVGAPALFVELILSNPPAEQGTWPVDDRRDLRRKVREKMSEVAPDLELPWFVTFQPEDAEPLALADRGEQVDVDV